MIWPFKRKPAPTLCSRGEALAAYLEFMEGKGPSAFSFPPGDYRVDQVVSDVEAIIRRETEHLEGHLWRVRLRAFQEKRGKPWR